MLRVKLLVDVPLRGLSHFVPLQYKISCILHVLCTDKGHFNLFRCFLRVKLDVFINDGQGNIQALFIEFLTELGKQLQRDVDRIRVACFRVVGQQLVAAKDLLGTHVAGVRRFTLAVSKVHHLVFIAKLLVGVRLRSASFPDGLDILAENEEVACVEDVLHDDPRCLLCVIFVYFFHLFNFVLS